MAQKTQIYSVYCQIYTVILTFIPQSLHEKPGNLVSWIKNRAQ